MERAERFDVYVERALYGPDGFYTTGRGGAGRRTGDFITSPEVGPLFAEVVLSWVIEVWRAGDSPDGLRIVDLGGGPGTLTRAMETSPRFQPGWSTSNVDLSSRVTTSLPENLTDTVVLGNELLDNLPFRWGRVTASGPIEEAFVADGELMWRQVTTPVEVDVDEGDFPIVERAGQLIEQILEREPLAMLFFDYGSASTAELAERGEWLRCYRAHVRGQDPLFEPGRWDITTDVPLDQLPTPDRLWTQAEFLRQYGIDQLVTEGAAHWAAHASAPDLQAIRMRSRSTEAAALTDPTGLGEFWVAEWLPSPQR